MRKRASGHRALMCGCGEAFASDLALAHDQPIGEVLGAERNTKRQVPTIPIGPPPAPEAGHLQPRREPGPTPIGTRIGKQARLGTTNTAGEGRHLRLPAAQAQALTGKARWHPRQSGTFVDCNHIHWFVKCALRKDRCMLLV